MASGQPVTFEPKLLDHPTRYPRLIFLIFIVCLINLLFSLQVALSKERSTANRTKSGVPANLGIDQNDYSSAIQSATITIAREPRNSSAYITRARALIKIKDIVGAIKDITSALKIEQNKIPNYYRYRGDCFVELGRYDLGIKDYTTHLSLDPNAYKTRYYRARAYALSGQSSKALQDIDYGLRLKHKKEGWFLKLREAIILGKPIPYNAPVSN